MPARPVLLQQQAPQEGAPEGQQQQQGEKQTAATGDKQLPGVQRQEGEPQQEARQVPAAPQPTAPQPPGSEAAHLAAQALACMAWPDIAVSEEEEAQRLVLQQMAVEAGLCMPNGYIQACM